MKTEGEINQGMCRLNNASVILLRAYKKKKLTREQRIERERGEEM